MKKIVFIGFFIISFVNAQKQPKIGYIDMDYILERVPEYAEAVNQLEGRANDWKQEIEIKKNDITKLKESLATEKVLLTKELVEDKEKEIKTLEVELFDLQQKRFGPNGDLFLQKASLAKPVQDQVFNIVQDIAAKRQYDYIFDKSSDLTMLYTTEKFDVSDFVLKELERSGKKVELSKRQQKKQDEAEKRSFDIKENPQILEKEKALIEKKEAREKVVEEKKSEIDSKRKEAEIQKAVKLAEQDEERKKTLEERKKILEEKKLENMKRIEDQNRKRDSIKKAYDSIRLKKIEENQKRIQEMKDKAQKAKEEKEKLNAPKN